jgi:Ca-activated chloride channel family protein
MAAREAAMRRLVFVVLAAAALNLACSCASRPVPKTPEQQATAVLEQPPPPLPPPPLPPPAPEPREDGRRQGADAKRERREADALHPLSAAQKSVNANSAITGVAVGAGVGYVKDAVDFDTERYAFVEGSRFRRVADDPLSTFSIDVDTASYANVRRFLQDGQLPPPGAVRVEELINAFSYAYPRPSGSDPFAVSVEAAACPWDGSHRLVRVALAGREIEAAARPSANVVFLVDVSGSMMEQDKLPLVQQALKMFATSLDGRDSVAIAVYAGAAGLVLPPTSGSDRAAIEDAIGRLQAGGSTNGAAGIRLAYETARARFIKGGINRVVLATDGDFNVGTTSEDELVRLVEGEAKAGIYLTVLGVGRGNLNDAMLDAITRRGNGQYAYLDSVREAQRVLVEQAGGTLVAIAKDVKIQVEFNPATVNGYRLIGYETRILRHEEFNDDRRDAGDIGSGHTVTAFYEVVPAGVPLDAAAAGPGVDPLKYQAGPSAARASSELLTVKVRYKQPDGDVSSLIEVPFADRGAAAGSPDFSFAAGVAAFGLALRAEESGATIDAGTIRALVSAGVEGPEPERRRELAQLVERWQSLRATAMTR